MENTDMSELLRPINGNVNVEEKLNSMESKELRIGNYVSYRGEKQGKVSNVGDLGFSTVRGDNDLQFGSNDIEDYEPIPLTEEWLLKFGFEKGMLLSNCYFKTQIGNNISLTISLGELGETGISYVSNIGEGVSIWGNVKYVHQLQNLYFALTQTELENK